MITITSKWVKNSAHTGTLTSGTGHNYTAGASGQASDYAGNFSSTSYYVLENSGDFSRASQWEISYAVIPLNNSAATTISMDNNDLRIRHENGDVEVDWNGDGTDCQILDTEYNGGFTNGAWNYVTVSYNGSSCAVFNNRTLKRNETATGTGPSITSFARLGKDNSVPFKGVLDCLVIHINSTLSDSERTTEYNDCFSSGGESNSNFNVANLIYDANGNLVKGDGKYRVYNVESAF